MTKFIGPTLFGIDFSVSVDKLLYLSDSLFANDLDVHISYAFNSKETC